MSSSTNKIICKVAKDVLSPLGFIRVSDRHWVFNGSWWATAILFQQVSWSKGAYVSAELQCMLEPATSLLHNGLDGPRVRVNHDDDDVKFESELRDALTKVVPVAVEIVNRIHSPGDLYDHLCTRTDVSKYARFSMGVLCALDSRNSEARSIFQSIIDRAVEYEHERIEQAKARFGLQLLETPVLLKDYAEIVIRQNHSELLPADARPTLVFPWR